MCNDFEIGQQHDQRCPGPKNRKLVSFKIEENSVRFSTLVFRFLYNWLLLLVIYLFITAEKWRSILHRTYLLTKDCLIQKFPSLPLFFFSSHGRLWTIMIIIIIIIICSLANLVLFDFKLPRYFTPFETRELLTLLTWKITLVDTQKLPL